jgi:hypothetical protein
VDYTYRTIERRVNIPGSQDAPSSQLKRKCQYIWLEVCLILTRTTFLPVYQDTRNTEASVQAGKESGFRQVVVGMENRVVAECNIDESPDEA